jgi:hypothetical protein
MTDPALIPSCFDLGDKYGTRLGSVITSFYKDSQLGVIKRYYNQLHQLDISISEKDNGVEIALAECAESEAALKKKELLDFTCGELQGLVSSLLGRKMVYKESFIEGSNLKVRLSAQT